MILTGMLNQSIIDPDYILEESNFNFRYVWLCNLDIPRENWLNCLQTARQAHDVNITLPLRRCKVMTLHRR